MSKSFDPSPLDKHADNQSEATKADKEHSDRVDRGLEGSFPASDPVSASQPAKSKPDAHPTIIDDGEKGPRVAEHPKRGDS